LNYLPQLIGIDSRRDICWPVSFNCATVRGQLGTRTNGFISLSLSLSLSFFFACDLNFKMVLLVPPWVGEKQFSMKLNRENRPTDAMLMLYLVLFSLMFYDYVFNRGVNFSFHFWQFHEILSGGLIHNG